MKSMFQENLKKLAEKHTQKYIAQKTGFSQSSVNNYISKASEPSIQFLVALKNAFGIDVNEFLFSDYSVSKEVSYDRFLGNYIMYYYNNDSYKGEVHSNLKNTLNYGVLSIYKEGLIGQVVACAAVFEDRSKAIKLLEKCNHVSSTGELLEAYKDQGYSYEGKISTNDQSIFLEMKNNVKKDQGYIILNNPPSKSEYKGGVAAVCSIARGREHNPCIQFMIISKKLLDVPDGELYESLKFDKYEVNMDDNIKDIINLFKRLYVEKNDLASDLTETQKMAIVRNKIEYHLNEILEANVFRFAKVSNREDDRIYRLIREGLDV